MKNKIKNQITSKILKKISKLEKEKNQEKQKVLAQEIIQELEIENFTPYEAYDDEGNIFIALNYVHSSHGINECLMAGKHDVILVPDTDIVYIEDESFLEEWKNYFDSAYQDQKEYDEISEK
jgi:hypothetical protein